MMSLLTNVAVALLSIEGQKALGFHLNYLNLCSEDERMSYGWAINDSIFYVNYPFNVS